MKRTVALSALLVLAMLGAVGLNSAQAQIADTCFDPCLRVGGLTGHLLLPFSCPVSLLMMIIPYDFVASIYNTVAGVLLSCLEPVSGLIGKIPIVTDLLTLSIVFLFGALDTQKVCALSNTAEQFIVALEMSLVRLIP